MKKLNRTTIYIALIALFFGLVLGWVIFRGSSVNHTGQDSSESELTIWTCSMHPQIRQKEPGNCPICGMELVKLSTEGGLEDPMSIRMSPTAMQLANVQTSIISKEKPQKEIRMNGRVVVDERRMFTQSSHIPGRIEKLMISFTGEEVQKGQVLAYVYSPELITAQEELLEALKVKDKQEVLFTAAQNKLLNWKLSQEQVNRIIESGEIQEQFPILADVSGVVMKKEVSTGDYIKKGEGIFQIADLTKVWVLFDVYESELVWIKKGNEIEFYIESIPGETFNASISFVDPVIDPKTRVAQARIELVNKGLKLKPEMFAIGKAKSPIEDLGEELVVPRSAVMWTGEKSVVYVKQETVSGLSFIMRTVKLGPSLGDSYIVKEGLRAGEEIATNGTFSIDAAAQLAGKPSMMNQEGGKTMQAHDHDDALEGNNVNSMNEYVAGPKIRNELQPVFESYFSLKNALVADDLDMSINASKEMLNILNGVKMNVFKGQSHILWMNKSKAMKKALDKTIEAENIGEVRKAFKTVSDECILLAVAFGPFDDALYVQNCPMANSNKGADWISKDKKVANPYFGESMIGCGSVTKEIK